VKLGSWAVAVPAALLIGAAAPPSMARVAGSGDRPARAADRRRVPLLPVRKRVQSPGLRPQLVVTDGSMAALASKEDGAEELHAIKEAIARAQADTQAVLAAETRAVREGRARGLALDRARADSEAGRETEARMRADEEAAAAARERAAAEAAAREEAGLVSG